MKQQSVYLLWWRWSPNRTTLLKVFEDRDEANRAAERRGKYAYVEVQRVVPKRVQEDIGSILVECKMVQDELPFYSAYVRAYMENGKRLADKPKVPRAIWDAHLHRGGMQYRVRADTFIPLSLAEIESGKRL